MRLLGLIFLWLVFGGVLFSPVPSLAMGSFYREESKALWDVIIKDMIAKGVCEDRHDCTRQLDAYSNHDFNAGLQYYNLEGMNPKVLSSILLTVMTKGEKATQGSPIMLEFYRKPRQYYADRFQGKGKPVFVLKMNPKN